MERITLNVVPRGITPVCHASQYDKGRVICLDLMDGLQGYTLQGTETLELRVRKPDNNVVTAVVENTSSTYVYIVTTEQMTACEGVNLCELRITDGDDVLLGTLNFNMKVEADPLKDGIASETEIHNLETQIADINEEIVPGLVAQEVENQYDSQNVIFDDEPNENHGIGYAVTSGGLKSYIPKNIDDLDDVDISGQAQGEALVWDSVNNKWVNGTVSTVGSIDDLDDVDTTGKSEGDNLRYDGNEWVAKPNTIEMTLAEWNAIADKQAWRNAHKNTYLVISDAPNLNATAKEISYDGSTDTVWDKVEGKANLLTTEVFSSTFSVNANTDVAVNFNITKSGYTPLAVVFYIIGNKDCIPHAIILTNNTTATFHITNVSATAKSNISATATILFVKN